jgi:hypothetical protein
MGIISNELLGQLREDTRVEIANLSAGSQEMIAAMNVDSNERQKATESLVNFAAQYETAFASLMGNTAIPGRARESILEHLLLVRDSSFEFIEQLYNTELDWATIEDLGEITLT